MDIQGNGYISIKQLTDQYLGKQAQVRRATDGEAREGISFQDVLRQKTLGETCGLKFSKAGVRNEKSGAEGNQGFTGDCGPAGVYCKCPQSDRGYCNG